MHIDTTALTRVFVYPDGTVVTEPLSYMSDDFEVRLAPHCPLCNEMMEPHYAEPFASCSCVTMEWYK